MKHSLRLLVSIALLSSACSDPSPAPVSPPSPSARQDMDSTLDDMDMAVQDADMSLADMSPDLPGALDLGPDLATPDMPAGADMMQDMPPDMCEPETLAMFCARHNYACGELEAEDNCGQMRKETCGDACMLPTSCVPELLDEDTVLSTSCTCDVPNGQQICMQLGRLCGPLPAPCDGSADADQKIVCDLYCVDQVAAGDAFNCAIGSGNLRCWGKNDAGQLGQGNTTLQKNPTPVSLPQHVVQIATGLNHTCAILEDTSLICWGKNDVGQLGIGTTVDQKQPDLTDPNSRAIAKGVAKVVLGERHSCALVDEDFDPANDPAPKAPYSAYCWGSNVEGRIGNPDRILINTDAAAPILVKGLDDNVYDIAAGLEHTCAIITTAATTGTSRELRCWGNDQGGQLGARPLLDAATYQLTPTKQRAKMSVEDPNDPTKMIQVEIPTGNYHHYLDSVDENNNPIYLASPSIVRDPRQAATVSNSLSPTNEDAFTGAFVEIVAGDRISCVRNQNNEIFCWGILPFTPAANTCKLALHDTPADSPSVQQCSAWPPTEYWDVFPADPRQGQTPLLVPMYSKRITTPTSATPYGLPTGQVVYRAVSPRPAQLLHHPNDRTVYPSYLPTEMVNGETRVTDAGRKVYATQLSAHKDHICMLLDESPYVVVPQNQRNFTNIHCFGNNTYGQVGDNTNSPIGYPVKLSTDVNSQIVRGTQISVGSEHSCAVVTDNNIKCWGSNRESQLGNENLLKDESYRPFDVLLK